MASIRSGQSGRSRNSKKSNVSRSSNGSRTKKMFNEYQRNELKVVLAEKFKKKFKNQDGKWIEEQVKRFVDANDDLTSKKLKALERAISNGVDPLAAPS